METKQLKNCVLNLLCVLIIVIAKLVQTYVFVPENIVNRKINLYIGLFVTIPAFIIATITFYFSIKLYYKVKLNMRYLYLLIPYVFLILIILYYLINIFSKSNLIYKTK